MIRFLFFNFFIRTLGLFLSLSSTVHANPNSHEFKPSDAGPVFGSKLNQTKIAELLRKKNQNKLVRSTLSTNATHNSEGPGRSGGGNSIFAQAELLDQKETHSNTPILDWEKIPIFKKMKSKLKMYPELQAYLTQAFNSKQWYMTNQKIDVKGCLNATLNGINESASVIACQWEQRGLINQKYFNALSRDDQKIQLLIHEGLVHHMVVSLNRLEKLSSKGHVDQQQESMEFFIHKISKRILDLDFNNIYELNDELKANGFPIIINHKDYEEMAEQFYGLRLQDIFAGAKERAELMENIYQKAHSVDMSTLAQKYGSKACFIKTDGYSVPGFYSGAMISIDELFPSAQFALFPAKGQLQDEELIRRSIEQVFLETGVNIPLKLENSHWVGNVEVDVRKKFEVALKALKDPELIQSMEDFLKKQLGVNGLNLHQKIKLSIRSIKNNAISEYVIFKRELINLEKPNEVMTDYVSGQLIAFPKCLEKFQ